MIITAFVLAAPLTALAEEAPQRAKPPQWSQDVLDAFFEDARQHLVGARPQTAAQVAKVNPTKAAQQNQTASKFRWSALVDADTLTDEVKRINIALTASLAKPAKFKGGGNLDCQRDLSVLAELFGCIAEFDGAVRWQSKAARLRNLCLQTSEVCKVASDQSYAAAQNLRGLLGDLLQGQATLPASTTADKKTLANRPLLMQRMEQALEENISQSLANVREFRKKKQDISQEAQLLAMLAQVIRRTGYEYADDETYLEYTDQLREASRELRRACDESNYEAARAAAGKMSQSCSECHEGYRG